MIIRKNREIFSLPHSAKEVRVACTLTNKTARLLLMRCPRLKLVILTRTAKKGASRTALEYLKERVDVVYDYSKQGRPVKFSRMDLAKMISMRKEGFTYEEIAARLKISQSSVWRALNGRTKFNRWSEDYNGSRKVVWMVTHDADPDARKLADNHYSRKTVGAKYFCGPGEKLVLITPDKKALFIWRKNKVRWDDQEGVECALFRNEGAGLSSELIREAMKLAWKKWPKERLFTYVRPSALKSKDPGFCFKRAGWRVVGTNKRRWPKLIVLEAPRRNG